MPEPNPLDRMATELAYWADSVSTQAAESIKGGFSAPGAAQLSERQKLEFYTHALFAPDGSPNLAGRAQIEKRLGPLGFAQVYDEVTTAHPELVPPQPSPFVSGYRGPDGLPGTDIAPDGLPASGASVAGTGAPTQSIPMPTGPIAPDGLPTRQAGGT